MNKTLTRNKIRNLEASNVGSLVEIRRESAWYEGTITQTRTHPQILYTARYSSYKSNYSPCPAAEIVRSSMIRPLSPCKRSSVAEYGTFQEVEAFYKKGWWSGVVVEKKLKNNELWYRVFVVELEEELLFDAFSLRKRMEWVNNKWISAEEVAKDEDKTHPIFCEGKQVEVSNNTQKYGVSWSSATILKIIGKRQFFVEYTTLKKNKDTSSLQEIVDVKHIRPCPSVSKSTSFNMGDIVEVLHDGSWILGDISSIISRYRYIVKFSKSQDVEAKVINQKSLRPHYVWREDHWDQISQDVNGRDVGSISAKSKEKKNPCIHSDENEAQSTKKMKIDKAEKSFLREDYGHPSKNPSCESEFVHGLRPTNLFPDVLESENNTSQTFSIPDRSPSVDMHLNDIATQTQSSVDRTIKDGQGCHIVHVDNSSERQVDKSNGCLTSLINSAPAVRSHKIESPFSMKEKEEMIRTVESKHKALRLFPQDPHFHPLHEHDEAMREGIAYGSLFAFAGLVTAVAGYTADASEEEIEGKLKSLDYFRKDGFSIEPVQTYLNNFVMLRESLNGLEGKKKETLAELEEVKREKEMDTSLLSEIEKSIAILNEKRAYVILKMKKHDSAIGTLESVARRVEDDIASAKRRFNANLCSSVKKKMN